MDADIACFWHWSGIKITTKFSSQLSVDQTLSCHVIDFFHHTRPKVCVNLLFNNSTLPNHANTVEKFSRE